MKQLLITSVILTILISCNQKEYTLPHFEIGNDSITYETSAHVDMNFIVDKDEKKINRKIESSFVVASNSQTGYQISFHNIHVLMNDDKDTVEHKIQKSPINFKLNGNKLDSITNWEFDMNIILQSPDSLLSILAHKEIEIFNLKNLWNHYTSQPIKINTKWKDSLRYEMSGITHHYNMIYKLDKVENESAHIEVSGNVNSEAFQIEYNKDLSKLNGKLQGKIIVDLKSGMVKNGDFSTDLKISGSKNNQQFALSVTGNYKISMR